MITVILPSTRMNEKLDPNPQKTRLAPWETVRFTEVRERVEIYSDGKIVTVFD